jgi:hypothetical protein
MLLHQFSVSFLNSHQEQDENSKMNNQKSFFSCTAHTLKMEVWGHAVAQLIEALRYEPEGHGFDSRWCHFQ